ncbi:MAG: crossover junction endodeoxyribonuclease RuvC [Candidatus Omnitrophica bacterium]|nr:crossover junction endodeoxyribonuclease RuvC [Candidatus Omnitrophota bacterium]
MRILGVDPGLRVTGYGIVSVPKGYSPGGAIELLEAGIVKTRASAGIADRLHKIHGALAEVIAEFHPDVLVIEKLYAHTKHPATAILMGHVRGVVCLLSGMHDIPLVSLASTHVKKSVTGQGHAGKFQIQRMVAHYLGLKTVPEPADVADALAIAVSYAFSLKRG